MKVWVSNQFIGSFVTTKQISKDNVQKALTQFFISLLSRAIYISSKSEIA